MPIESATYVNQLVPANPLHTDGLGQADSHLRLIKQTVLNTFAAFTGIPVTATEAQLNSAAALFNPTDGIISLAPPSPAAGAVGGQVVLQGAAGQLDQSVFNAGTAGGLSFSQGNASGGASTAWTGTGSLTPAGLTLPSGSSVNAPAIWQNGAPLIPIGTIVMWYGNYLAIPSGWALCNGQIVNGYATPNLVGFFPLGADGTTISVGQTGGQWSVTPTTTAAGQHNHTGATGSGGSSTISGTTSTAGSHNHGGAAGSYALQVGDLPPHSHVQEVYYGGAVGGPGQAPAGTGGGSLGAANVSTATTGSGNAHSHSISTDGSHAHTWSDVTPAISLPISYDGSHTHTVTVTTQPPFVGLLFIMRVQ